MKTFLKMLLAVLVGGLILSLLPVVLFSAACVALMSSLSSLEQSDYGRSALRFNIETPIVDRQPDVFGSYLTSWGLTNGSIGLDQLSKALKVAATDENISCLILEGTTTNCNLATLTEVRELLNRFTEESGGKFIYYFGQSMDLSALYLASTASRVCVSPQGSVEVNGLSSQSIFFKGMMDKIGAEAEVFRCGRYKSAVEPFTQKHMSDASREQMQKLVGDLWASMKGDIARGRSIGEQEVEAYIDSMLFYNPRSAKHHGLVDTLMYQDQFEEFVYAYEGLELCNEDETISIDDYADLYAPEASLTGTIGKSEKQEIAVVYCEGEIYDGSNLDDLDNIYADDLCEILHDLRNDDQVVAVVLRINSPGGSASAAEQIWREIRQTRDEKVVVASLGDYAASGGYYIATAADHIYADETSITGSIGVFGIVPCLKNTFEKIGITADRVGTHESGRPDVLTPLTDKQKRYYQSSVDEIYSTFLARVAEGRHMDVATVDSIAQGRVWSGSQAKSLGLVDDFLSITNCIETASRAAVSSGVIDDVRVVSYPQAEPSIRMLGRRMSRQLRMKVLGELLPMGMQIVEEKADEIARPQIFTLMENKPIIEF